MEENVCERIPIPDDGLSHNNNIAKREHAA